MSAKSGFVKFITTMNPMLETAVAASRASPAPFPTFAKGNSMEDNFAILCQHLSTVYAPAKDISRLDGRIDTVEFDITTLDEKYKQLADKVEEMSAENAVLKSSIASLKSTQDKQVCSAAAAACEEKISSAKRTLYIQDFRDINQQLLDEDVDEITLPSKKLPISMFTSSLQGELDRRAEAEGLIRSPAIVMLRMLNTKNENTGRIPLMIKFTDPIAASVALDLINVINTDKEIKQRHLYRAAQFARVQDKQYTSRLPFSTRLGWALKTGGIIHGYNIVPMIVDRDKEPHILPRIWVSRHKTRMLLEVACPATDEESASLLRTAVKIQLKMNDGEVDTVADLILQPRRPSRPPRTDNPPAGEPMQTTDSQPHAPPQALFMPPPMLPATPDRSAGPPKLNPWTNHPVTLGRTDPGEPTPGQRAKKLAEALKEKKKNQPKPRSQSQSQSRNSRASSAKRSATSPLERPASDMAADEGGKVNTANKKNRA